MSGVERIPARSGASIPGELVARLEVASEGSRHLDYEIKDAINDPYWNIRVPAYWTTSLDAALALAERALGEKEALYVLHDVIAAEMANDLDMMALRDLPRILCIAILKATTPGKPSSASEGLG